MKFSIRNMLGVMIIISLVTIIFRRFLSFDMIHAFLAPYWVDLWLFNLESVWPFEVDLNEKTVHPSAQSAALIVVSGLSALLSIILHVIALVFGGSWIYDFFFKGK